MKVLVLGHKGMLGHMVLKYLTELTTVECIILYYRWPTRRFRKCIKHFKGDYIINCIGAIPQKTDNFFINYLLPVWLDQNTVAKIIYPGTDCEMDNDGYGKSKKKASNWIKEKGTRTKIIKTSIIGPELNTKFSLMEWFLNQKKGIKGFTEFYWNGNTTLTWAEYCLDLMENWDSYKVETILEGQRISKYSLLKAIKTLYNKDIKITKASTPKKDKCLIKGIKTSSIKDQLKVLKRFYN